MEKNSTTEPFYNSTLYCECLVDFGSVFLLNDRLGCLLERGIPHYTGKDLIYLYPMFSILDEVALLNKLKDHMDKDYITATIVTDPLFPITPENQGWDLCRKWKTHLVLDCDKPDAGCFSAKVRYYSKRSKEKYGYAVKFIRKEKSDFLDKWLTLWNTLVDRHTLTGFKALSDEYFRRLFSLNEPLLAVLHNDSGVHAIHIWITQGDIAYSHLHASDKAVYESSGNYLLYSEELAWLASNGYRKCLLGSSSGSGGGDGLYIFKKQFANSTCDNHLLGLIMNRDAYKKMTGSYRYNGGYFPAYRNGELL